MASGGQPAILVAMECSNGKYDSDTHGLALQEKLMQFIFTANNNL